MLQLRNICYAYDKKYVALSDISFDIGKDSFTVVCGTAGSGKSTLLKILGGVIKPDSGELFIAGKNAAELSQRHRDACLVSKEITAKNKTVYQSLAYGLDLRGMSVVEIDRRINSAAKLLDLTKVLHIKVKKLPQYLQQIASLARILVRKPKIALIDCPLDGLNEADRFSVLWAIKAIWGRLKSCCFVYTATDPFEAQFFDAQLIILRNSYFVQGGSFDEIINKPANKFVASYLGAQFLEATITHENGGYALDFGTVKRNILTPSNLCDCPVSLAIFPQKLQFFEDFSLNAIKCEIVSTTVLGFDNLLFIRPQTQKYLWAIKSANNFENCQFIYFLLPQNLCAYHAESGLFIDFSLQ